MKTFPVHLLQPNKIKMNRELWEFNEKGVASMENDANDYFYEWVSLEAGGLSLKEILEKFIDVTYSSKNIRVKARNGAIFIVVEGDKDDTPNPPTKPITPPHHETR